MSDKGITELLRVKFTNPRFSKEGGRITRTEDFCLDLIGQGAADICDGGTQMLNHQGYSNMAGIIFMGLYGNSYIAHKLQSYSHEPIDELGEPVAPMLRLTGELTRYTLSDHEASLILEGRELD